MEVHIRNLAQDLSEEALTKELGALMDELNIKDFSCEKPRQKTYAWVTFLHEADGQKFLKKHEKLPQTQTLVSPKKSPQLDSRTCLRLNKRDVARLFVTKRPAYVAKSNRGVDGVTLKQLNQEKIGESGGIERTKKFTTLRSDIYHLSCGKNMLVGPDHTLQYVSQSETLLPAVAKFGRKIVTIDLSTRRHGSVGDMIQISYSSIQELIVSRSSQKLTFVLETPPRFFVPMVQQTRRGPQWHRVARPGLWRISPIHVSQCLVYQVTIPGSESHINSESLFSPIIRLLKSREDLTVTFHNFSEQLTGPFIKVDVEASLSSFDNVVKHYSSLRGDIGKLIPFGILFQVQALVWNNYLDPESGIRMLEAIAEIARGQPRKSLPFTVDTMKQLMQKVPYPCPGVEPKELDVRELLALAMEMEQGLRVHDPLRDKEFGVKLSSHQAWVLKATVTPTRILLQGPEAESKNTVLRKYFDRTSYFLRVTFADEEGQDLQFNPRISHDPIYDKWRLKMKRGFMVCGRHFQFLGFSHSSLRSHSAWFSAPFVDENMTRHDCNSIIKGLGNFEDIRVPAKCAARIGQAFSETPHTVSLIERGVGIQWIDDVKFESRVFSDGVGTISWDALEEVWDCLPMRAKAPTCLQIRWGGVKGMIALDSRLRGKVICLRKESMMKFQTQPQAEMGICDTSSNPLRLMLNRQMVKILEDMGTKDEWFFAQQTKALEILRNVTSSAVNTTKFLEHHAIGANMRFPKLIKYLDQNGLDYRTDLFLKAVVEHTVLRELRLLKHKARIPVAKGVTLFGIMDETGFLEEGEVYVTYNKRPMEGQVQIDNSLKDGLVIVTRSPALHPGDIRLAFMKTPPDKHPLRQLENCIVFSQKGKRDLPSQLSGGDLDGDLYNVIWDPEAMPKSCFGAADYPRVSPLPLSRPVTRDDIAEFFINFMKTDILSVIAVRHVIMADAMPEGSRHPSCITLAEMHSTAVDFSKTGIPVNISELPKPPRTRPDFLAPAPPLRLHDLRQVGHIMEPEEDLADDDEEGMGMARHRYHKSEKILGRLFRAVDEKRIWRENVQINHDPDAPSIWTKLVWLVGDKLVAYDPSLNYDLYLDKAWWIRDQFESTMADTMWSFSEHPRKPLSEVEVFCGSVMNRTGSQTRRQREASIKLKEEVDRKTAWVVQLMVGVSDSEADSTASQREVLELCMACLVVGCVVSRKLMPNWYHQRGDMHSFKVLAASCLLREMDRLSRKHENAQGGGFVGVAGGGTGGVKGYAVASH